MLPLQPSPTSPIVTMTRPTPRVSIGLPVYNGERFLGQALDSLLAQTFDDFELIISDNASTDRTHEICAAYAAKDRRIRCVRNSVNIGANRNFNRVFQISQGMYFKWASADDFCHMDLLKRCLEALDQGPSVVLVYPKTRFIDEHGNFLNLVDSGWDLRSDDPRERFRYVLNSGHWCNLFYGLTRREALTRTHLFPIYSGGDYRLAGELSLLGKFIETQEYLFFRRLHSEASSQNRDTEWHSQFFRGKRGHPGLPFWHLCFDHSATVGRSTLDFKSKLALQGSIIRRMFLAKRQLFRELRSESMWLMKAALRPFASRKLTPKAVAP